MHAAMRVGQIHSRSRALCRARRHQGRVFYPNKGGEWMYEAFMDLLDCTREPKASETREKFRLIIGGDGDPMAQLKPIRIELNVAGAKEWRP